MRLRPLAAVVLTSLMAAVPPVRAASPQQRADSQPQVQSPPAEPSIQALGVSLDRIRRQLRETPPTRTSSPLKLEYHVEVVGTAPRLKLFVGFDIGRDTAVQYGGMTHAEFLKLTAPPWRRW